MNHNITRLNFQGPEVTLVFTQWECYNPSIVWSWQTFLNDALSCQLQALPSIVFVTEIQAKGIKKPCYLNGVNTFVFLET